jgi:8-oxo-dGTP diphosphatase
VKRRTTRAKTSTRPRAASWKRRRAWGPIASSSSSCTRSARRGAITVAYYALVRPDLAPLVRAGGDVSDAEWFEVSILKKMELAFDHRDIINLAIDRVRGKLDYSDIAFELVPVTFTIPELRHVYSIVTGKEMDPGNFRRRFNRMIDNGVLEKAPGKRITVSKPATVYRFKRAS